MSRGLAVTVIGIVALGLALRLATIAEDPLHPDECLYASWAAAVWPGGDLFLRGEVVDKPPLYPYLLAAWSQLVGPGPTALRLLGVAAALAGLISIFRIARAMAGAGAAVTALVLAALSPAAVALDATAFTDPVAVALALGAALAAAKGRAGWSGLLLGLAAAAKPTAIAILPLVLLMDCSRNRRDWARLLGGIGVVALAVGVWEGVRAPDTGFLAAAFTHYGVGQGPASDWSAWMGLLGWLWGRPEAMVLSALLIVGGGLSAFGRKSSSAALLLGTVASAALYLMLQALLAAPAWDRYLLLLVPLVGLAAAGSIGSLALRLGRKRALMEGAVALTTFLLLLGPAQEAAQGRLPLGDTSAWQGIEGVAAYVRGQVPGRATVLYRDLGWHIGYYLADFPQDFVWYQDREGLVGAAESGEPVYLLAIADREADDGVEQLRQAGFHVAPALTTYRYDGTPTLVVYAVTREGR